MMRPIKTAPLDGTTILIYGPVYCEVGSGSGDKSCWTEAHWAGAWVVHIQAYYALTAEPTHWAPLPE